MTPFRPGADYRVASARLELRRLRPEAVTQRYVDWLNDPDVIRYLEIRGMRHDLETVTSFVEVCFESEGDLLFGVYADGEHIGNVKLSIELAAHGLCTISYLLGQPGYAGRGMAGEAVAAATRYAIDDLGALKVHATAYANNQASIRLLRRIGYRHEGQFRRHMLFEGALIDVVQYGFCADDLSGPAGADLIAAAEGRLLG